MFSKIKSKDKAEQLRQLLNGPEIIVMPGCFDALSAKLIEREGLKVGFMSGFSVSSTKLGMPDTGLISFSEMAEQVRNICNATSIPIIFDGDTGYGNSVNVFRTVRGYADAGAAGVMIEDQKWPKKCGHTKGKDVVDLDEANSRIKAAVDAREYGNKDILIMARTDAIATRGLDDAIERMQSFSKLGVDILFIEAVKNKEDMKRIIKDIHPDVYIEKDDTVIFSSKIIPGNEKKLYSLHNEIVKKEVELITEETDFVHVSGHPNRDDLKDMYNWVKPNSIIPVHGEHRHMNEHIKFAKEMQVPHALRIEDGDIVRVYPGKSPEIIDKAPSGRMYLDGSIAVGENSQSIKERKSLSQNGYLEITLILSNSGKLNKPVISYRGIPENSLDEKIIFQMEDEIFNTCRTFSMKNKNQEKNMIEMVKQNCRRIIKNKTGKKPFTNINIARL